MIKMMKPHSLIKKNDNIYWFLLFLISPIISLILAFKKRNVKISKSIFILFCLFYGFTFIFSTDLEQGSDSSRYAAWLIEMHNKEISWPNFINTLYNSNDGKLDILQPLLTYIVAIFTDDPRFLFAVFALVFGFFYAQNIWILFEKVKIKPNILHLLFIIIFILLIPLWSINGFRFWTASQIFIFGALNILVKGKKSYFFISLLSLFVHFSFVFPMCILLLYLLVGNKSKLYFVLFVTSIFLNGLNIDSMKNKFNLLPEVFQQKEVYLSEDFSKKEVEGINKTNWYIKYNNEIKNWICYTFIFCLFINRTSYVSTNKIFNNLFNFSMLYFAFANFIETMPQGVRFFPIGHMIFFFLLCLLLNYEQKPKFIRNIINLSIPFLILIFFVSIRRAFEFIGLTTLISNPIIVYWMDNGQPIINFIK